MKSFHLNNYFDKMSNFTEANVSIAKFIQDIDIDSFYTK